MSKCHSCKLRYVCEESAEWECTHNGYRGYMQEDSVEYSSNAVEKVIEAWNRGLTMDEYIKRKTVIDLITRRYENSEICTQEINSILAADVAPVAHGRWVFGKDLPYSWGQIPKNKYHLYCSECLEQAFNRSEDNDPDFDVDTSYCPSCGAKMNGGDSWEWIPVTERLPEIPDGLAENPEPVLYMMKNTKTIYAGYYGEGGLWRDKYFRKYADSRNGVDADDVLCWMYQHDLPKPPKGE